MNTFNSISLPNQTVQLDACQQLLPPSLQAEYHHVDALSSAMLSLDIQRSSKQHETPPSGTISLLHC
nr:hypothetical protein [Pseudomonas caspiana]